MGMQAPGTVFNSVFQIDKAAAALICQAVQRAVAKQAAEGIRICTFVAGKILTFPILKKVIMAHTKSPSN